MVDQVIKLKRNTTNTNAPGTSDIAVGELAIGAVAGKLYIRKSDDSIVEFTDASAGGSTAADDITAGDAAVTIATTADKTIAFSCITEKYAKLVKNVRSEHQRISQ